MFSKLKNLIIFYIMILSLFFTTMVIVTSIVIFRSNSTLIHMETLDQIIEQNISNSMFAIDDIKSATTNLIKNEELLTLIDNPSNYYSVQPYLNTLKSIYPHIKAATIYTDHTIYSSDNIDDIVTLSRLVGTDEYRNFFQESSMHNLLSVRTENISGIYNKFQYSDEFGIITYMEKVYLDNVQIGYIFIDIDPISLYNTYFNYSFRENEVTETVFLDYNDEPLLLPNETSIYDGLTIDLENDFSLNQKDYIIYSKTFFDDYKIISIFSKEPLEKTINTFNWTIGGLIFPLNIVAFLIALGTSNKITKPIERIRYKMASDRKINE